MFTTGSYNSEAQSKSSVNNKQLLRQGQKYFKSKHNFYGLHTLYRVGLGCKPGLELHTMYVIPKEIARLWCNNF